MMQKKFKFVFFILLFVGMAAMIALFLSSSNVVVLHPKGMIGDKQRDLIVHGTLLMLIVVIPVFILTLFFAWKYRASNKKAKHMPEWAHSYTAEAIWWGLPCAIVLILSVMTYKSSHELDPFKPLNIPTKPLHIQVVALNWKWLFIYPEQKIATVNYFQFPEKTPLNFEITSDAPMNSFWLPQLGGQIYAMPGMSSKLHLIANEVGSYRGSSANLSGKGFAGMTFIGQATTEEEFNRWVDSVKESPLHLNLEEYNQLVEPSENHPMSTYVLTADGLYEYIVMKYMMPMP